MSQPKMIYKIEKTVKNAPLYYQECIQASIRIDPPWVTCNQKVGEVFWLTLENPVLEIKGLF